MKKSVMKAAAVALVFAPSAVSAELLSQKRLAAILASDAPGPVDVETMHSRDKDLLVTLGVTLREKYGSLLNGSEVIFTRMERSGRIVYRMDFINVKTEDHADGICQILEMEKCVILSQDGDASLISAEIDEDGLLSLDEYVPFSGPVRMEKFPTKPSTQPKAAPKAEEEVAQLKEMRLPLSRPHMEVRTVEAKPVAAEPVAIEVPKISVKVAEKPKTKEMALPMARPGSDQLLPEVKMALPIARPAEVGASEYQMALPLKRPDGIGTPEPKIAYMSLPTSRPVADFGLQDHLPQSRDKAFEMAEQESDGDAESFASASFIADTKAEVLIPKKGGFSISMSGSIEGLEGYSLDTIDDIMVSLPGAGKVFLGGDLPSVNIKVEEPEMALSAIIQATETGIEMEIDGSAADLSHSLPKTFVLSFAEDGVKAIANPVVAPSSREFEIASVVMTDAFSRPFDVRGDGSPDLQKLPKMRPDMSFYDTGIELVSERDSAQLLSQLLKDPVEVAQVPGASGEKSPGDRMLEKLLGGETEGMFQADLGDIESEKKDPIFGLKAEVDPAAEPAPLVDPVPAPDVVEKPKPAPKPAPEPVAEPVELVTPDVVVEPQPELPRAEDGLVDLDSLGTDNRAEALRVLGQIASGMQTQRAPDPQQLYPAPKAAPAPRAAEPVVSQPAQVAPTPSYQAPAAQQQAVRDTRGIFDVANYQGQTSKVRTNAELRIELSFVSSREQVKQRANELQSFIPDVIMNKGRFYGFRVPSSPNTYIIGIEARDMKSRDDIIWYLERMQIPWAVRAK